MYIFNSRRSREGGTLMDAAYFLLIFFMLYQLSRDSLPPNMLPNMMLLNK